MVDGPVRAGRKILHVFDDQSAARHFADVRKYVAGLGKAASGKDVAETGGSTTQAIGPSYVWGDAGMFEFAAASDGEFVSTYGIFDAKRFSPYLFGKRTFRVSVGDRLDERALVSKLLTFLRPAAEPEENESPT